MSRKSYFDPRITMAEYLADRGRWAGSVLRMLDEEPERFGRWMRGEDVDRPSPAKARGAVIHCLLLEGIDAFRRQFARFPNRNEGLTEEKAIPEGDNPRTGKPYKTATKTGQHIPQDESPAGARKSMIVRSAFERQYAADWRAAHAGKVIWYPEDEPIVAAAVRAVRQHPEAAALLERGGDFGPEVTAHWECPHTGQPMRSRFDALRCAENRWIELKTYDPGKHGRMDTMNPRAVIRWVQDQGFHIKSAMNHEGYLAVTGQQATGYWIVVEATEDSPRVSVVRDVFDSMLAELGRKGSEDWGIKGYPELVRLGCAMRQEDDYRHDCVRETVDGFPLPAALLTSMQFEEDRGVQLQGARVVAGG